MMQQQAQIESAAPLAYCGVCVGGPVAGMHYTSGEPLLRFPYAPVAGLDPDYLAAIGALHSYIFRQVMGLDLWVPPDWSVDEIVQELGRHYRPLSSIGG